ncbi:MAG: C10 family peptidase [Kiritimatiellae bacterium]|nr:C10 family peptidase [Kiritimatiellia bacterium]
MKVDAYSRLGRAFLLAAASICGTATADPVAADQAMTAARRWLRDDPALGCALRGDADGARTFTLPDGSSFHVVKMSEGGFVVMSADTRRAPVVAFSSGAELVEDDSNPLWVLLKNDLAVRTQDESATGGAKRLLAASSSSAESANEAKWAKLLGGGRRLLAAQGMSSVSDMRVAPLVKSKWNQDNVGGNPCYNYYTPNNYVCGCVATAGAQIMRYFRYPTEPMPQYENPKCAIGGVNTTLTTQGGTYSWDAMPLEPGSSITDEQRMAIGKLTSDVGICCNMNYNSNGSSAGGHMLAHAFTNHFGYASAMVAHWQSDQSGSDDVRKAMLSNFDAGLPVALSLSGAGGHEIVGDGYGYSDGTLYIHFNMGWGGFDDAWYAPPAMGTTQYNFSVLNGIVYNVFTNHPANAVICSGRVLDADGIPVEDAMVSFHEQGTTGGGIHSANNIGYVRTNQKGIYSLVLTPGTYTMTASSGDASASTSITLQSNVSIEYAPSGGYWTTPAPKVNNVCDNDFVLTGVASVAEPQFSPGSCLFYPSTNVTISCATDGAEIRYTTDGSDPTESSTLYTGAITLSDDAVLKARAWKSGMNPSVVVTATYTYDAAQGAPKGDYFDNPIVISGASGSRVIEDNSAYTVEDGEPWHTRRPSGSGGYTYNGQYRTVWYQWTAPGSGTMTLATKCSGGGYIYPTYNAVYTGDTLSAIERLAFSITRDDNWVTSLSFEVEQGVTYRIVGMMGYDGSGTFTLSWSGDLTVAATETSTTDVPVPYIWLDGYYPGQGVSSAAYEALANDDSDGDGFPAWQEYLLGTDPTNAASRLFATVSMNGGTPVFGWSHTNANIEAAGYRYAPKGRLSLDDSAGWQPFASGHRFFKVVVEPVAAPGE